MEVQLSLVATPLKDKKMKMRVDLSAIALLNRKHTMVHLTYTNENSACTDIHHVGRPEKTNANKTPEESRSGASEEGV